MRARWKMVLIFIALLLVSAVLYLYQNAFSYLFILAAIAQVAGYSLRDFFKKRRTKESVPEITVKREYGTGLIRSEEIRFTGPEAVARYVDGLSSLLSTTTQSALSREIAEAAELVRQGRYAEAKVKAHDIKPHESYTERQSALIESQANLVRGDAAYGEGLLADAERYYSSCGELAARVNDDSLMIAAALGVAIAKGSQGRHAEALKTFEKVLKTYPDYALVWINKGVALCGLDRYDDALAAFNEAITLNPQYSEAWLGKGASLTTLGKHEEALTALEETTRLNPKDDRAWYNRGMVLGRLHKYDEALEAFKEAININPSDGNAWLGEAACFAILGRRDEASVAIDHAIQVSGNNEAAKRLRRLIDEAADRSHII